MKLSEKFNISSAAWIRRWVKILKKKSDESLIDLYERHSAVFCNQSEFSMEKVLMSIIAVHIINITLKQRYPKNKTLQEWNINQPINLRNIIGGKSYV